MKILLAFVAATFLYLSAKLTFAPAVLVSAEARDAFATAQVAWGLTGTGLLYGLSNAFLTEWTKRGDAR